MRSMVEGKNGMSNAPRSTVKRARQLRRALTFPEILLWTHLRQKPGGWKFRRQHPLGPYILDFYCPDAGLVIEVDGISHNLGDRAERDGARDEWLKARGLRVLRIPAQDVLDGAQATAESIVAACETGATPLHHPSGGPPPRPAVGEEQG